MRHNGGVPLPPEDVRIFISYSHEAESHNALVKSMALRLKEEGFEVFLDALLEVPPTDWPEKVEQELSQADVVLCVCTPTYATQAAGEVPGGAGRGAAQEAAMVRAEAFDQKMRADRFRVVQVPGSEVSVPAFLGGTGTHVFQWPTDHDSLVTTLKAPTKRRRILKALRQVFDDDVEALSKWAEEFVVLGRDQVLDFDDRARRVASGLMTHKDPQRTKHALQQLVEQSADLLESLEVVADELRLGKLQARGRPRASSSRKPTPLAERLEALYQQREDWTIEGKDTTELNEEILELRRKQRIGSTLKPGEFLEDGRFRLIEVIGRGGFATVWKAYDRTEDDFVAIKVLHGEFEQNENRRERLFRGALRMRKLRHPNVVEVRVARGEEQGFFYYVMEYVPGGDLHQAVRNGSVDPAAGLELIESVAMALHEAHQRGLVHRDVKPHNIMLREDGTAALTDFDLVQAKDTTGGTRTGALGTVMYSPPEQNRDAKTVDLRADVFGLGMTAVFCVHGKELPYDAMYGREAFFEGLECHEGLREVLAKAAAVNVEARFESMVAFAEALREARRDGLSASAETETVRRIELGEPSPQPAARGTTTDELIIAPRSGVELVRIPEGRFMMGSPTGESGRDDDEGPQHEVELDTFYLARTPVTNAQYRRFLEDPQRTAEVETPECWDNPQYNHDEQPVVGVSWTEAKAYCEWAGLLLPTEAQWEYACRAGTRTRYHSGNDEADLAKVGWYGGNSKYRLQRVAQLEQNGWGLYDMHGNVDEWCEDAFDSYGKRPRVSDGLRKQPVGDAFRVLRGGAFGSFARHLRSAIRYYWRLGLRGDDVGFRPAQGIHS